MSLTAVLFDFNGVIINDEPIHEQLIGQILLEENLRVSPGDFKTYCLGRSDRAAINDLLLQRGRLATEADLQRLVKRKGQLYRETLMAIAELPIYPHLAEFITQLQAQGCKLAVVSGALRSEIEWVLEKIQLRDRFDVIVAGDEITASKPEPDGYLLAIERLRQQFPDLAIQANQCLAIEDTFAGLEAAKRAGVPVVGIANTYPFHMMQRRANWAIDYFTDLELERVNAVFETKLAETKLAETKSAA